LSHQIDCLEEDLSICLRFRKEAFLRHDFLSGMFRPS
jgi:hypothetical protein